MDVGYELHPAREKMCLPGNRHGRLHPGHSGRNLSKSLAQDLTLESLRTTLSDHMPEIYLSDQGLDYADYTCIDLLNDHTI
jgi:hypothetical protein